MSKPRLGIGFEGALFPGRLRMTSRLDLDEALRCPAVPGRIAELMDLIAKADIAIYPLWPARERAHFIARWLKRRFADDKGMADHPLLEPAVASAMACLEIADRRPEDLDATIDYTAPGWNHGEAFAWPCIHEAMQRGWSLDGARA